MLAELRKVEPLRTIQLETRLGECGVNTEESKEPN
jgi:hypothetical protein